MPWEQLDSAIRNRRDKNAMAGTAGTMRLLLDNNVDLGLINVLDGWGLGAHGLPDGMESASDEDVLDYAYLHDRVLLTHDEDFLNEIRFPPERNPGVVILPGGSGGLHEHFETVRSLLLMMKPWPGMWLQTYVHVLRSGIISIKGVNATSNQRIDKWFLRFVDGLPEQWVAEMDKPV